MKIGYYHHGQLADLAFASVLSVRRISVCERNASMFGPADFESEFTEIILDEGPNSVVIREGYEARSITVRTPDEFLENVAKAQPSAPAEDKLNPDKPRAKPRGKKQGEPKQPKTQAPKAEDPVS
ncbi:hypothetical protein ABIB06_006554 [Bradyrhizobium sp. LB8.2]|uniref:hypothetical protein n=1 Tax=unclassified Bradyrhizobium TaxID=2631580 RepID=UPI003396B9C2